MAAKKTKKKAPFNFYQWLRSGLRSMSRRFPPVYECLAAAKRQAPKDAPARQKIAYECAMCKGLFPSKQVAVDHTEAVGSLSKPEDIAPFVLRLFCDADKLRVLCHTCHDAVTLQQKVGGTLEEAFLEKRVIAQLKKKQETLALLREHGYTGIVVSNETKRRNLLREILSKENKEK